MKIMYKIDIDTGVTVVFIGCEVFLFLEEDPGKKVLIRYHEIVPSWHTWKIRSDKADL